PLWKAAPALAYGNAVLLKPSSEAIATALRLAEILEPHLPPGVFEVVPGGGEAGQAVIEVADVVAFTGSNEVGRAVTEEAAADGGRVLTGGVGLDREGYVVAPTLVDRLDDDAVLAREEVFGPIAAVIEAPTAERAAEIDAAAPYGLVTSVFTRDLDAALVLFD